MRRVRLALLGLALAGCATAAAVPDELLDTVDRSLTLAALRQAPEPPVGARVMLGGEILATIPRPGETEVEVLGRRLRDGGAPEWSDVSDGRFLFRTTRFLDPAVYAPGRRVTVVGSVTGAETRRIGELPYRYPVLAAERIVLWPRPVARPGPPPWPYPLHPYHDPFWDWPRVYLRGHYSTR
jgi:outer membrane lipoprotein